MKTTTPMSQKKNGLKKPETAKKPLMKKNYHWPFDLDTQSAKKTISFLSIIVMTFFFSSNLLAQNNTGTQVKGIVSDENGPVDQVTITLKGTDTRTITDKKGMFTFPQALKENDVLVFSHLGYHTQEIKIDKNAPFIEVELASETVQMLGALQSDKPYKSKRKK